LNDKKDNISQFDELFKQGLENHSIMAPQGVFEAVSAATSSAATAAKVVVAKWIVGGLVAAAVAVGGYYAIGDDITPTPEISKEETALIPEVKSKVSDSPEEMDTRIKISKPADEVGVALSDIAEEQNIPLKLSDHRTIKDDQILKEVEELPLKEVTGQQKISKNENKRYEKLPFHAISISGNMCQGSSFLMDVNTKNAVDWYVNDEKLRVHDAQIEYRFLSKKPYSISAYINGVKVADTFIDMSSPKVKVQLNDLGSQVNELSASTSGIQSAAWVFEGRELSNQRQFIFDSRLYKAVPYLVTTDRRGCKDTFEASDSKGEPQFKFIQTVITPDGNGKNDDYEVLITGYETFTMIISDVNGRPVFTTNDPNVHWNGRNQITNQPCKNGSYGVFVTYKLKNSKEEVKDYEKVLLTK